MNRFFIAIAIFFLSVIYTNAQDLKIKNVQREREETKATKLGYIDDNTVIYLRGTFNEWGIETPFTRIANGVYRIENITLFNGRDGMKIASDDWKIVDIGGVNSTMIIDGTTSLVVGGDNLFIDGLGAQQTVQFSSLILDLNSMTLVTEKSKDMHPHISLDTPDDTEFMTDEMPVRVSFNLDTDNGEVIVVGKNHKRDILVRNNVVVNVGKDEPVNTTIDVICIARSNDGTVNTDTVHYVKSEPTGIYVYFNNPEGWKDCYCYLWSLRGDHNYPWPGEKMEWDGETIINGKRGWWKTHVSNRYSDYGEVIFNNNDMLQTAEDLSMEGESMVYDGIEWKKLSDIK